MREKQQRRNWQAQKHERQAHRQRQRYAPTRQQQHAPAREQQPQKTPGTCEPHSYACHAQTAHSHQTHAPKPCSPYAQRHYHEATCQQEQRPHNHYRPSHPQREPARAHAQHPHHQQTRQETPTRAPETRSRPRYRPSSIQVLPAPTRTPQAATNTAAASNTGAHTNASQITLAINISSKTYKRQNLTSARQTRPARDIIVT